MAKYLPIAYKCPKCKKIQKHYIWDNEKENSSHTCECGSNISFKDIKVDKKQELIKIRTPTKNRY